MLVQVVDGDGVLVLYSDLHGSVAQWQSRGLIILG